MSRHSCALLCCLWLAIGCSQPAPEPEKTLQRREVGEQKALDLAGVSKLKIEVPRGSITVRCEPSRAAGQIKISRFAQGYSAADADRRANEIHVATDKQGDVLLVKVTLPSAPQTHEIGADLVLRLPARLGFDLSCDQGNVEIGGASGDVKVSSRIGAVDATTIAGNLSVDARRGPITVRDVTGSVTVRGGTGDIEAYRPGPLDVSTRVGTIRVYHPQSSVALKTERGEVLVQAPRLADRPTVKVVTVTGAVRLEVPITVQAKLNMRAGKGLVTAFLDGVKVTNRVSSENSFVALLNGGGGTIDVKTGDGAIHIASVGTRLVK